MTNSDLLLLFLPECQSTFTTAKIFEYLYVRKPILVIAPITTSAVKIISAVGVGALGLYPEFVGPRFNLYSMSVDGQHAPASRVVIDADAEVVDRAVDLIEILEEDDASLDNDGCVTVCWQCDLVDGQGDADLQFGQPLLIPSE